MTKQKRDNAYYLERLRKARPDLHQDVQDGKMTAAQALAIAGIKKPTPPLTRLRSAWKAASEEERDAFLVEIGACIGGTPASDGSHAAPAGSAPAAPAGVPIHRGGYLEDWAKERIVEIMEKRGLKMGTTLKTSDLIRELGVGSTRDASIATAIHRGARIANEDLLRALERWLEDNASP